MRPQTATWSKNRVLSEDIYTFGKEVTAALEEDILTLTEGLNASASVHYHGLGEDEFEEWAVELRFKYEF